MKNENLLKAIGNLDEDLIEEYCLEEKKQPKLFSRKTIWFRKCAIWAAAALILLILPAALLFGDWRGQDKTTASTPYYQLYLKDGEMQLKPTALPKPDLPPRPDIKFILNSDYNDWFTLSFASVSEMKRKLLSGDLDEQELAILSAFPKDEKTGMVAVCNLNELYEVTFEGGRLSSVELSAHAILYYNGQLSDQSYALVKLYDKEQLESLHIKQEAPLWSKQNWVLTATERIEVDGIPAVEYQAEHLAFGHYRFVHYTVEKGECDYAVYEQYAPDEEGREELAAVFVYLKQYDEKVDCFYYARMTVFFPKVRPTAEALTSFSISPFAGNGDLSESGFPNDQTDGEKEPSGAGSNGQINSPVDTTTATVAPITTPIVPTLTVESVGRAELVSSDGKYEILFDNAVFDNELFGEEHAYYLKGTLSNGLLFQLMPLDFMGYDHALSRWNRLITGKDRYTLVKEEKISIGVPNGARLYHLQNEEGEQRSVIAYGYEEKQGYYSVFESYRIDPASGEEICEEVSVVLKQYGSDWASYTFGHLTVFSPSERLSKGLLTTFCINRNQLHGETDDQPSDDLKDPPMPQPTDTTTAVAPILEEPVKG